AEQLFEQFTQRGRAQLLGKNIWEECPAVADSVAHAEYHRAVAEQRARTFEVFYPPLRRWFELCASPSPGYLSVYFQDVTERRRLEQTLLEKTGQLAAEQRGREDFLVRLAHALRNPLASIRNAWQLLGELGSPGEPERARAL